MEHARPRQSGALVQATLCTRPRFSDVAHFMGVTHERARASRAEAAKARSLHRSASLLTRPTPMEPAFDGLDEPDGWWEGQAGVDEGGANAGTGAVTFGAPARIPPQYATALPKKRAVHKKSKSVSSLLEEPQLAEVLLPPSDDTPEEQLAILRMQMIGRMGSAKKAFLAMDTNGSGSVSFNEFERTFPRMLGLMQKMPDYYTSIRRIWRLLDANHTGSLDFKKVFPNEVWVEAEEPERMNTPDFWDYWCRKTKRFPDGKPVAAWQPPTQEHKIKHQLGQQEVWEENIEKSRRMKAMIKRLKTKGKSDAKVREIVCKHLPRGTGEPDFQDVPTFSASEMNHCKAKYKAAVNDSTRNIRKDMLLLRDSRRALSSSRQELGNVVRLPARPLAVMQDPAAKNPFAGLGPITKKSEEEKAPNPTGEASFTEIGEKHDMDADEIEHMYKMFLSVATGDVMGKRHFNRFMRKLCPAATLVDSELEAWFLQACQKPSHIAGCWLDDGTPSLEQLSASQANESARNFKPPPAAAKCTFEQWIDWFGGSDARVLREGLMRR